MYNYPMFLKIVRSAQGIDYVYVVEGYRDSSGRIRHRYLFSLGKLEDLACLLYKNL